MKDSNDNSRRLRQLTDHLLDERITDAEMADLNGLLLADTRAQEYVLDQCQFHAMLMFNSHVERAMDGVVEQRKAARADQIKYVSRLLAKRTIVTACLAIATMLLVALGIRFFQDSGGSIASSQSSASAPKLASVRLTSGSTQVALANFGSVTLEGPGYFEMLTPMRARLHHGRIRVRITDPKGHGFVVETPNGEVTDLGTEFGLDVSEHAGDGLVVFEGAVGLRVPASDSKIALDHVERLVEGEGVVVNRQGQVDRIMAIFTGRNQTFGKLADFHFEGSSPVIVGVRDNLRTGETRKFYNIVPNGFRDDVRPYADRNVYEWNAVDAEGMPEYLVGADYVRTFNNDKMRKTFEMHVTLSCPARLFVIFDDRVPVPDWLSESFIDTGDNVGMDISSHPAVGKRERPPGVLVDHIFSVWERRVPEAGTVTLGPNEGPTGLTAMYGIAAIPLNPPEDEPEAHIKAFRDRFAFEIHPTRPQPFREPSPARFN